LKNFDSNLFLSFGDGIFNGTYLIYSTISNRYLYNKKIDKYIYILDKSNSTINEILTDDMNILDNIFYIQLSLIPLSFNHCISKNRFVFEIEIFGLNRYSIFIFIGLWIYLAID
jgi:hypothetical protein